MLSNGDSILRNNLPCFPSQKSLKAKAFTHNIWDFENYMWNCIWSHQVATGAPLWCFIFILEGLEGVVSCHNTPFWGILESYSKSTGWWHWIEVSMVTDIVLEGYLWFSKCFRGIRFGDSEDLQNEGYYTHVLRISWKMFTKMSSGDSTTTTPSRGPAFAGSGKWW